jgi:glycosyltransferase involved in cell wall biosynthesis
LNQRVCFVSQRYYPGDARIYTQISALQEAGYKVDIICMKGPTQEAFSSEDGVNIYRLPSMVRQRQSKIRYIIEYASFWIPAFLMLTILHLKKRYRVVDVTNLPDVLLFSAIVPKLMGAKIIYDVRECSPEIFADRFEKPMNSRLIRLIARMEQACLRFADMTVTCTEQMRQAMIKRGGDPDKIGIVLNVTVFPNTTTVSAPDPDTNKEFRIATHGTIIKRYGHEVLIRAMALVVKQVPQAHLEIIGRGNLEAELKRQVEELGLQKHVTFAGFLPADDMLRRLSRAHVGVVPLLRNPEADIIHTHKMFEFISFGTPTVISRTSAGEAYFGDDSLYFVEAGNPESLANALIDLANNPEKRQSLVSNARQMFDQYAPAKQRAAFVRIVNNLLNRPDSTAYDTVGLRSEN